MLSGVAVGGRRHSRASSIGSCRVGPCSVSFFIGGQPATRTRGKRGMSARMRTMAEELDVRCRAATPSTLSSCDKNVRRRVSGFQPYSALSRLQENGICCHGEVPMGAVIGIADLRRRLGHVRVLDGRHLQVDVGEVSIVPGQNGARTIARAPTPCCSVGHRGLLAQNQFVCRCHRCVPKVLVAQAVQRGYSSVGDPNTSFCDVDPHLVSRSPGALPCR